MENEVRLLKFGSHFDATYEIGQVEVPENAQGSNGQKDMQNIEHPSVEHPVETQVTKRQENGFSREDTEMREENRGDFRRPTKRNRLHASSLMNERSPLVHVVMFGTGNSIPRAHIPFVPSHPPKSRRSGRVSAQAQRKTAFGTRFALSSRRDVGLSLR
jgi:hypothetical protein